MNNHQDPPLVALLKLLERIEETHWSRLIKPIVLRDPKLKTAAGIRTAQAWFGGMGSLNDMIIHPLNGHIVKESNIENVNEMLQVYLNDIYEQTQSRSK